jgi:cysteinyl-tRNA synthetase
MTITLYNTLTRQKQVFEPLDSKKVGMYVCGPTVYDFAHIGNARPVVVFDVLARLLRHTYPQVCYVRNITDVDDKINAAAHQQGKTIADITRRTTAAFHADMAALNAIPPDIEPRATAHIQEMIDMISTLVLKGHAYEAQGHVLFRVASFSDYGQLSRRNQEDMIAGARVEVAPYKQRPEDFVLWKPSVPPAPGWESPWGFGRPGWHIECSAMSHRYLNSVLDIHGGGQDLIFPHHENELAQSRCSHGEPVFARYWMHNGHVTVNGEKMSKSAGNFFTVRDLLANHSGEAIRLGLLSTHYRQPLDWTASTLEKARQVLDRLYTALKSDNPDSEQGTGKGIIDPQVHKALCDDLNTPQALTHLHDLALRINKASGSLERSSLCATLIASGKMLGLLQKSPQEWFQQGSVLDRKEIDLQMEARQQARLRKDFAESDRIRQALLEQGIILEDSPAGTTWRRE